MGATLGRVIYRYWMRLSPSTQTQIGRLVRIFVISSAAHFAFGGQLDKTALAAGIEAAAEVTYRTVKPATADRFLTPQAQAAMHGGDTPDRSIEI